MEFYLLGSIFINDYLLFIAELPLTQNEPMDLKKEFYEFWYEIVQHWI